MTRVNIDILGIRELKWTGMGEFNSDDYYISGSSAFSKTSLNIWKFTVHVLLKPGLENSMNCGAWQDIVHGIAKSQTRLSN